ncbi:MAG: HAMP domain-containing protein, partial [Acidobacteriota bacterium]
MESKPPPKQKRYSPLILGGFALFTLSVLFILQSSNLWKEFSVETVSDTLLLYALSTLNFIAFVVFGFIFLRSIVKLARERRTLQLGSRLKTRLFLYFAAISLLPIIAMAGFSYLFMNRALDRWFTQIPENVVLEARDVQAHAVADRAANLRDLAMTIATMAEDRGIDAARLNAIVDAGGLARAEVISADGRVTAYGQRQFPPDRLPELEIATAAIRSGRFDDPALSDGLGFDAASAEMRNGTRLVLIRDARGDKSVSKVVDNSLREFDLLKDKQITVRQVGVLTLGVLTFLLIFASSWAAFYIARGLTGPIKALAEGADAIAAGDLSHRVEVFAEDELALLVATFNDMSARLEENSSELRERRKYIETVLESLPTGVISVDRENRVGTINRASAVILGMDAANFRGRDLSELVGIDNRTVLERVIARAKRTGRAHEQAHLHRENSTAPNETNVPAALTATALADGGAVLVIEDLSELISAQRALAWQEVARRMAHEIKNPLTPIQLSAERIAKRCLETESSKVSMAGSGRPVGYVPDLSVQTARIVREGTDTILREVQSLKAMVDEFSRFARLPEAKVETGSLNEIVQQVVDLYSHRHDGIVIVCETGEGL